jgi:hypothetical protein
MKTATLRLIWLAFAFFAAYASVSIFSENMALICAMLCLAMILLPIAVYRALRDGFEAKRKMPALENGR